MRGALAAVWFLCWAVPAAAQQILLPQGPILTLDEARFFEQSQFGRRVDSELAAAQAELLAENRKIEAELSEEERALTERRAELPPEEFRALADAFDARVQSIRATQEGKSRALLDRSDATRAQFFPAARDVLAKLMAEAGAVVILSDEAIVLSFQQIDVTDVAIARLDAAVGDGAALGPRLSPDGPAQPPTGTTPAPATPGAVPGATLPAPAD